MSESQAILSRIHALRDRLSQVHEPVGNSGPTDNHPIDAPFTPGPTVEKLEKKVKAGSKFDQLLESVLRQLPADTPLVRLPAQMTSRAHRLLERGKDLLVSLRNFGGDFSGKTDPADALLGWYETTVAMTDMALRTIGTFPDTPSAQLGLCEGVEAILDAAAERVRRLTALVNRRRTESAWIETLLQFSRDLEAGHHADWRSVTQVAEAVLAEQRDGTPLRFLQAGHSDPARYVACGCLNVAQVMARAIRNDPVFARKPVEPILAALLHDLGMISVPAEAWLHGGALNDSQRQLIEQHARLAAEWIALAAPDRPWLSEAVGDHHERLNGTGYPGGMRANQISWLPRLLAVCDVYAALCSPRPHRVEKNTRTALTDVLMMAEAGTLDRHAAERLLQLSLFPAGTVVELGDGSVGVVIAVPVGRGDLKAAARPVVALLADYQGHCLPFPKYIDLAVSEAHAVVRSFSLNERHKLLATQYPEFV